MKYELSSLSTFFCKTCGTFLLCSSSFVASAQSLELQSSQLRAPFSRDLAMVDRFDANQYVYQQERSTVGYSHHFSNRSRTDKTGASIYKALSLPKSKLQGRVTGAALMLGAQYLGYGEQFTSGFRYLKQKMRYQFGRCGMVKLSAKRVRAQSCFGESTKLEFKSTYKLDTISLNFQWAL